MRLRSRLLTVWKATCLVSGWGLLAAASAGDVRDAIPLPVDQLFERLLTSSETGHLDVDRVRKSLDVLRPLVDHLNQQFGLNIDEELLAAVAQGRHEGVVAVIQRFIALSVRSLLEEACTLAADRSQATPKLKQAYIEYLVLDYYVQRLDFESSKALRNQFRQANVEAGTKPEAFIGSCREIGAMLERFFSVLALSYPGGRGARVPFQSAP